MKLLNELKILDWQVVLLGYDNGWLQRKDVVDFALTRVENRNSMDIESCIAFSNNDSDSEFADLVSEIKSTNSLFDENNQSKTLSKWKYLRLYMIMENESLSEEEKYLLLNELYYEFGLPDEMLGFWKYRSTDNSAIDSAWSLMKSIENDLGIGKVSE